MKMKALLILGVTLASIFYAELSPAENQGASNAGYGMANASDLLFMLGKTAEEAGLAYAGRSEISGTIFGHQAHGTILFGERSGKQVVTGMSLSSDIPYDECFAALKALYDIPFETNVMPYVQPYGASVNASFFTGTGTVTIQQSMNAPSCSIHISNAVPDEAKLPVMPVSLETLNAHMGMDLQFDDDLYRNMRIARIQHGDNPIYRVKYSDPDGNERRVYMQKRQTNVVPSQFDPDITWKGNWEHEEMIGDPLDATGRNLTCYEYDGGGMGCVSWYKNGNFAVLMPRGATKDALKKAMGDIRKIIAKGKLKHAAQRGKD